MSETRASGKKKAPRGPLTARTSHAPGFTPPASAATREIFVKRCAFTQEQVVNFPEKLVFQDYNCKHGAVIVDLRGWVLHINFFRAMQRADKNVTEELRLDDALGLTQEMMDLIRGFTKLRRLSLARATDLSFPLAQLLGSFPKLQVLDLSDARVDLKSFTVISQVCQMLISLTVQNCRGLDDYCMQMVAQCMQRFRRLKTLDFARGGEFNDEGMLIVLSAAPKLLTSLSLREAKNLSSLSITGLRQRMPALTNLDVSGMPTLTQTAFEWIAEGCRALVCLDLTKSLEFDDAALIRLGASCPHLEKLYLSKCFRLTDKGIVGFHAVFEGRLRVLDLTACIQCGGASALALASKADQFVDLKLNGLSQVSEEGLMALWSASTSLKRFEMSVELRSTVTHRKSMMPHISDAILCNASYTTLREVKLSGACLVTDKGACALVHKCPNLLQLDVSYCGEITDLLLETLASVLPLTFVSLSVVGCGKIRDEGIERLTSGCVYLKLLEISGCYKVGDKGMQAIARLRRLETLAVCNCDSVNTEAMLAIANGCIQLRSVEFSGMDMVSIDAVKAFASCCKFLTHMACDNCNFSLSKFKEATKYSVALGQPQLTRSALEARPRPVMEHNKYVLRIREMDRVIRIIQRFCRAILVRVRSHRHHQGNKQAVVDIRRLYAIYTAEKGRRREKLWKALKRRAVVHIQRWFRRRHGVLQNQRKVGSMLHRNQAAKFLQRVYRGHMARKRVRATFERLYRYYTKFGHLVWRATLVYGARIVHRHITAAQSVVRMFLVKLNYWLFRRAIRTLQIRFLKLHRRRQDCRRVLMSMLDKLDEQTRAANFIRKNWRIRMFNKTMASYVFFCCIVWRSRDDEKDWRLLMLQSWYRGSIVRLHKYRREQVPIVRNRSIRLIQRVYRGHVGRVCFREVRTRLKGQMARWRALISKPCALRIGRYLKPFQRGYKLHFFLVQRDKMALVIMKVWRGSQGRKKFNARYTAFRSVYASKLQIKFRVYKARRWRKGVMAIMHMAAWRIQRQIKGIFTLDAMQRIKAKTAARHRRDHVAYKRQLLVDHWTISLQRRREGFMNLYASRIQKRYRSWALNKYNKALAIETRAKLIEQVAEEVAMRSSNRFWSKVPNPVYPAIRIAKAACKQLMSESLVLKADEPRLFNAVLKFNTKSIVQVGLINIKLTFGEGEWKAFEAAQIFAQSNAKPFYELLEGDLSGKMRLNMRIWIMRGQGIECITQLKVRVKPINTSMPQLRSREAAALMKCEKICWHQLIHFELLGRQTVKEGKGGFSITNLKIVYSEEEGEDQKESGWQLLQDMNAFGMPSFIWMELREAIDDSDLYKINKVKTKDWMDARLIRVIHTFNMSEIDVLSMRKVYDSMLGASVSEMLRLVDLFEQWGVANDEMSMWIIAAVNPARSREISFSEYCHIVCYFSMFGKKDLRRFMFGCMDAEGACFLKRDKFMLLVAYLSNPGVGNVAVYQSQYDKFKDRKLDSLFYSGFEAFTDVYRGVMWKAEEFQKKVREKHLGVPYWDDKLEQFVSIRKTLGVKLI